MVAFRRFLVLLCAAVFAALGVFGIVRFHASFAGVTFHAFVLLCSVYLASTALRTQR
jgi:hypothetical protein